MDRARIWLAVWVGMALLAGRAEAAGISIVHVSSTGVSTSTLAVGDVLTFELVANNDTNLEIYGIGISAIGYEAGLDMIGAESVSSLFNTTVLSDGTALGGFDTNYASRCLECTVAGTLRTMLFNSVSLSPHTGDGSLDLGLGGSSIADGDVHFRISFQATSLLDTTELELAFGVHRSVAEVVVGRGGSLLPFENATWRVAVLEDPNASADPGTGEGGSGAGGGGVVGAVPEPGAALLFAAGLLTTRLAGRR